jgi:hypothetical protein
MTVDKFAMFFVPEDNGLQYATAELGERHAPGAIPDINDVLPKDWNAEFTRHLYPIESHVSEMLLDEDWFLSPDLLEDYRKEGVTHVALLESKLKPDGSTPFYFSEHEIKHISLMVLWCGDHYRSIHCKSCCHAMAAWMSNMQGEWDASLGTSKRPRTLH